MRLFSQRQILFTLSSLGMTLTVALGEGTRKEPAFGSSSKASIRNDSRQVEALKRVESGLGTLESWQKNLFDQEVLLDPERFFTEIKSGVEPNPDLNVIKDYLKFHASRFYQKDSKDNLLNIWIKAAKGCVFCVQATVLIKQEISAKLANRGLAPRWITQVELNQWAKLNEVQISSNNLLSSLLEMTSPSSSERASSATVGALLVEIRPLQGEEIDQAHLDEVHIRLGIELQLLKPKNSFIGPKIILQGSGETEVRENEELAPVARKILGDSFGEVGIQTEAVLSQLFRNRAGQTEQTQETLVKVTGVSDYPTFLSVSEHLEKTVGEPIILRRMIRGEVDFTILTDKAADDLNKRLADWDNGAGKNKLIAGTVPRLWLE